MLSSVAPGTRKDKNAENDKAEASNVDVDKYRKRDKADRHQAGAIVTFKDREEAVMAKVKSLSGGFRDNDPPESFYKRKGITPPEKLVSDISWWLQKVAVNFVFVKLYFMDAVKLSTN